MPPLKDLTGQTFDRLTVICRDTDRKGVYWLCRCTCGNMVSVRAYHLTSGNTKSCGCLNAENIHKKQRNSIDLTGRRYGALEVIKYVDSNHNGTRWECKCHRCGSISVKTAAYLKSAKSCGCISHDIAASAAADLRKIVNESGSSLNILRDKPNSNNTTTGVRGISFISTTSKYVAYITYKRKTYTLIKSTDINKCIAARKAAEKAIRNDFLDWLEKFRNNN